MGEALVWCTGPAGGGWHVLNVRLAGLVREIDPGLDIAVVPGGGRENPLAVQAGAAAFGTSVGALAAAAREGRFPYEGTPCPDLACIGAGWSALPFHVVRAAGAAGRFEAALAGGRLRIGLPALSTVDELTFRHVMAFLGTGYAAIAAAGGTVVHGSYTELGAAFDARAIDWMFGATTCPADVIAGMGAGPGRGVLEPLAPAVAGHLATLGYGRGTIPAGSYPAMQAGDVPTTVMQTAFLAGAHVAEEAVFRLVRAIMAAGPRLGTVHPSLATWDPAAAVRDLPVPLHPGAARAYGAAG